MLNKLMLAMLISITAIFTLIWQQDQMTMFFGTVVAVVSIVFVTLGGAVTSMCAAAGDRDKIVVKAEAFATGSILIAIVATFVGLVAILANLDNPAKVGPALAACLLCALWAAVYKFLCNLIITSRS